MQKHNRSQHIHMMRSQERWPWATVLPLYNVKQPYMLGYLSNETGEPQPIVILGNMMQREEGGQMIVKTDLVGTGNTECMEYQTFESLYDEGGWRCD